MLCRGLGMSSAVVWAVWTAGEVWGVVKVSEAEGPARAWGRGMGMAVSRGQARDVGEERLVVAQIVLSYLWVSAFLPVEQKVMVVVWMSLLRIYRGKADGARLPTRNDFYRDGLLTDTLQASTAAYLAHLFTSSLMSRWLLHYSPFAVTLRLLSISILLSYACMQSFRLAGAFQPNLVALSRSLPIWIIFSIVLLLLYFCTQQDISVEKDRDDRRRRLVLRIKCLYAIAGSSLLSLLVLVCLMQVNVVEWGEETWGRWVVRMLLGVEGVWNERFRGTKLEL